MYKEKMDSLLVGQLVGHSLDTYQIERLMGHSKMNAVYLARHSLEQHMVMLTVFLLPDEYSLQARKRFRERFAQVASTLIKLDHPCILPVYDFGEQEEYSYIVTPLITTINSLAGLLKQQSRLTPAHALKILRQVAAGFDYAHSHGVLHRALKSANILLDDEQRVLIAGFGQANMLELRGIEEIQHPYMHLLSIAKTFLGAPEYIAPEVVQGKPFDARADIYALGVMLFEMLTGESPFAGMSSLTTALQHVDRPVPSLLTTCPDLPFTLDLIVQRALQRDPAQRYQSAEELVSALERVLAVIDVAQASVSQAGSRGNSGPPVPFPTLPPEYDWFDEEIPGTQLLEKEATGAGGEMIEDRQMKRSDAAELMPVLETLNTPQAQEQTEGISDLEQLDSPEEMSIDPFVWWSTASLTEIQPPVTNQQNSAMPFVNHAHTSGDIMVSLPLRERSQNNQRRPLTDKGRRRTVALLAATGVAFLGALGIDGMMLAQRLRDVKAQVETSTTRQVNVATPQSTVPTPTEQPGLTPTPTEPPSPTPVEQPIPAPTEPPDPTPASMDQSGPLPAPTEPPGPTPTPTTQPSPTPTPTTQPSPTPTPTTQPSPTPTPTAQPSPTPTPGHTGLVVGSTSQGNNTSKTFTNPADGKKSLLIRLSNGNFIAFESVCTHEGATCYYDSSSQKIVCPRHNALFDPNNGAAVLQGPPNRPLASVPVKVNSDGTVTAG
jgi:serine/threonine-protein kinase